MPWALEWSRTCGSGWEKALRSAKPAATILLVDDDPLIRRLGRELLENLGFKVATAQDGPEALKIYGGLGRADLVILDYYLPGQDGGEVLLELRALDAGVRVLMASGFFTAEEANRLLAAGAVGLIYKPYRLKELQGRIGEILTGRPEE